MNIGRRDTECTEFLLWVMQKRYHNAEPARMAAKRPSGIVAEALRNQAMFHTPWSPNR